mgnify:CR=1 FL=1
MIELKEKSTNAHLVIVKSSKGSIEYDNEEFISLTLSAGAAVKGITYVDLRKFVRRSLIGKGKMKEIKDEVDLNCADLIVFNYSLSASQERNLEQYFKIRVIDRTRLILDIFTKLQPKTEYFPIDISEILTESSEQLLKDYDTLHITGIIDTYEGGLEFLKSYDDKKNLILFLGSSFGNFTPDDGKLFLEKIFSTMKSGDLFLIGLDLVKDKNILESAYDDSQGVTAKFNLNVLSRINDELDADFDINNFSHYSIYNENAQRIEMNLKSLVSQSVILGKSNLSLNLDKGELIHTEYSHKYCVSQIKKLLSDVGFEFKNMWLDDEKHFSLTLVSKN